MPKETKSDKIEVARRITIVQQLIIKGFTNREIAIYANDNWGIQLAMAKNYIKKASVGFVDFIKDDVDAELNTALERRLSLFRKMEKQAENPKCADVALKILQDIARLKGQYVEKTLNKVEVTGKDGEPITDPLAPVLLNVNIIKRDADDIQRTPGESILEPKAGNA